MAAWWSRFRWFFAIANLLWLGLPFGMAILWSLVDPQYPWSYPDIFPQVLSFNRWLLVWEKPHFPKH